MTTSPAPELTILQPGEGEERDLGTIGVVFKLFGEQTNGQVSIVEHPFPVGACVPPHIHTLEDEYSIVTAGEIGFRSGDREVVLGAGGYITKPRGEAHTMWNAGSEPARMIEVISPAGFEHFFWAVGGLVASGPPDPQELGALAEKYGLVLARVPWLDDIIERFHLTRPPGA
ncbi:quercetin dioxygenase-like cupin family protein [Nocardioides ginsengisegetis]|uniref:Quercetin dioxygenase-like cupin family protein n=1 Tax=Nocardioides ginsengisegetis TaxID=661491 RepID=A0A7W3IXT4_9ACTN|nr:cupin domain-containing protein [Nocardioides ginsengisegetis]MBA8802642.1 quercetin dioxygenase-like cupin family protein [Nocardioides ginsengisegetis]